VKTEEENKTFLRLRETTWIEDTGTYSTVAHNTITQLGKKKKGPIVFAVQIPCKRKPGRNKLSD